jgi:O-succinylbenzoate synthase
LRADHPDLSIAVDANGSYRRSDTEHLAEMARVMGGVGYIEQPLAAGDLPGLRDLASHLVARVALDESIVSATDAGVICALGQRGLVNVKPARLGGVNSTLALSTLVAGQRAKRRPETFLGGMYETGVGRSAAATIGALTVTRPEADLGPSAWYFDEDVTEPIELDADGTMPIRVEPGLTRHPLGDRLAAVAVDRLTVRR